MGVIERILTLEQYYDDPNKDLFTFVIPDGKDPKTLDRLLGLDTSEINFNQIGHGYDLELNKKRVSAFRNVVAHGICLNPGEPQEIGELGFYNSVIGFIDIRLNSEYGKINFDESDFLGDVNLDNLRGTTFYVDNCNFYKKFILGNVDFRKEVSIETSDFSHNVNLSGKIGEMLEVAGNTFSGDYLGLSVHVGTHLEINRNKYTDHAHRLSLGSSHVIGDLSVDKVPIVSSKFRFGGEFYGPMSCFSAIQYFHGQPLKDDEES